MRVAFISTMTAAPWGGSEVLWSAAARASLDAGWDVDLSTHHWPVPAAPIEALVARGAVWHPRGDRSAAPERPGWRDRLKGRSAGRAGGRPDEAASPFAAAFGRRPDVVCVSQGGTFDFLLHDDLGRLVGESERPYVVLCRFNSDELVIHESLQAKAIHFLSNAHALGFAAERNIRTAERQIAATLPRAAVVQSPIGVTGAPVTWPGEPTPLRFACVARLEMAYKGQDLLLQALGGPAWRDRDWHLSCFGDGPDRAWLEALAGFYGLGDRVSFEGHVPDIAGVWASHHLLVLPSRAEGTPQSLIQAMMCGRPAVVTDVGGTSEWVTDGETGFLAGGAQAASIAAALDRAWHRRSEWPAIGARAREAASVRLDPDPAGTLCNLLRGAAAAA